MKMTQLVVPLLFLVGLVSCGKSELEAVTGWPMQKVSSGGAYTVSLQLPDGREIKQHEHFSLLLTLLPETASNAEPKKLVVTADMPAHRHGMNTKPEVTRMERNQYRVDGMLFHMAGDWLITVKLDPGNGKSERADFRISVE